MKTRSEKIRRAQKWYPWLLAFGLLLLIPTLLGKHVFSFPLPHFVFQILGGVSGAFIGGGAMGLIQVGRTPERARKYEIEMTDERNIKAEGKAGHHTWFVTLILLTALTLTLSFLEYRLPMFLTAGVLIVHALLCITLMVYYKRKL